MLAYYTSLVYCTSCAPNTVAAASLSSLSPSHFARWGNKEGTGFTSWWGPLLLHSTVPGVPSIGTPCTAYMAALVLAFFVGSQQECMAWRFLLGHG